MDITNTRGPWQEGLRLAEFTVQGWNYEEIEMSAVLRAHMLGVQNLTVHIGTLRQEQIVRGDEGVLRVLWEAEVSVTKTSGS